MKRKNIIALTLVLFILDTLATGLFAAIIFHLLEIESISNHTNQTTESILFGPNFLVLLSPAYMLATPIFGYCSDVFGRKFLLLVTICCDGVGYVLCLLSLFANSIVLLLLGLVLLGIGNSNLSLTLTIIADVTYGKVKAMLFAFIAAITNTLVLIVVVGKKILTYFNYTATSYKELLLVLIVLEILSLMLLVKFLPETNNKQKRLANFSIEDTLKTLSILLSKKQIRFLLALLFSFELITGLYNQYIFTYLTTILHITIQHDFFINCRTLVMSLSLIIFYPLLLYRWNIKNLLAVFLLMSCIGLAGACLLPNISIQWFCWVVVISAFTLLEPLLWALLSNCTSRYHQGLMLGAVTPLWMLAWIVSSAIVANNHFKLPLLLWIVFFLTISITIVVSYRILKWKREAI